MDAVAAAKCHLRCYYDIVTYRLTVWNHDYLSISKYLSIAVHELQAVEPAGSFER